jgi:DNA-binding XRE family transcriptional regulator
MARKHRFESPALQYLYDRYVGNDPNQQAVYEQELVNAQVARAIYDLRTRSKMTQAALAKQVGTTPSVISRLEDSSYEGHSLGMLRRIAKAFHCSLEIRFQSERIPRHRKRMPAKKKSRRISSKVGKSRGDSRR